MSFLITGGFGFIGNHVTEHFFNKYQDVVVLDSLTYASDNTWLKQKLGTRYNKLKRSIVDIRDANTVQKVIKFYKPTHIINLAAESHVCNSIVTPALFYQTNTMGTFNLIDSVRQLGFDTTFLHVSTDEVFGDLKLDNANRFNESTPYAPTSPYSSSKAAADMIVRAFHHTYGLKTFITNCSNNFGPAQHVEKLIPRTINRLITNQPITIYGSGLQVRDWLWVKDHAQAIDTVISSGKFGETYCVGGDDERTNIELIDKLIDVVQHIEKQKFGVEKIYTNHRPTDDLRYAIDSSKLKGLGWKPSKDLENKLAETYLWYRERMTQK